MFGGIEYRSDRVGPSSSLYMLDVADVTSPANATWTRIYSNTDNQVTSQKLGALYICVF